MPPVLHVLCNVTILSEIHYSRFVLFVKNRKRAAPPDGGAARRISAQPEQRLHPQPELEFELDVPPTLPHEPQPHRRQHPQPVGRTGDRTALLRAGAGTGAGGICGRSTADRAGRLSAAGIAAPLLDKVWEYEATEAAVAGRSHFISLHKRSGNVCSRVILCRKCPNRAEKQQNPDGTRSSGFWIQKSKENSTLGELRRAASCLQAVLREFLSCFPLILRDFPAFCLSVIRCADHKKRHFFIQQ